VPGIHTIQWVPGSAQKPGALQWMDFFRRVQRCGRSLHIGFEPPELEELIRNLDPRRCNSRCQGARSYVVTVR